MIGFILTCIDLYSFLLVIYALMSWIPRLYETAIGRFLTGICEPFLSLFRRLPLQFAGLDFSVVVALIALEVIRYIIVMIL